MSGSADTAPLRSIRHALRLAGAAQLRARPGPAALLLAASVVLPFLCALAIAASPLGAIARGTLSEAATALLVLAAASAALHEQRHQPARERALRAGWLGARPVSRTAHGIALALRAVAGLVPALAASLAALAGLGVSGTAAGAVVAGTAIGAIAGCIASSVFARSARSARTRPSSRGSRRAARRHLAADDLQRIPLRWARAAFADTASPGRVAVWVAVPLTLTPGGGGAGLVLAVTLLWLVPGLLMAMIVTWARLLTAARRWLAAMPVPWPALARAFARPLVLRACAGSLAWAAVAIVAGMPVVGTLLLAVAMPVAALLAGGISGLWILRR